MRPQITFPKSLKRAMNYHEKKVQKGSAELLHAHSFYKLPSDMNFHDKKERFEELMKLNERAENKLIHISINFHPSEAVRLNKDFYIHLADEYMNKIGFGNQPYLVYRHDDAGHPHIHVLSTLIQEDGKRISTQYIGKNVSEPARKEMELKYGFIPADKKEQQQQDEKKLVITPQKVQAGKSATMRSITNVLDHVIEGYKYTSLQELNAVLKLFNVRAERGAEDGRIYKNKGLTYAVINKEGKALTKPIKASAFHNKPTLARLEKKFEENKLKREPDKKHIKTSIDWAMQSKPSSLAELATLLQKEKIDLVARQNKNGQVYGITYVNHEKKAVFNGSDLGKEYAAKRILERLSKEAPLTKQNQHKTMVKKENEQSNRQVPTKNNDLNKDVGKGGGKVIEQIIGPDYGDNGINKDLLTEEQKRRKRNNQKGWEI